MINALPQSGLGQVYQSGLPLGGRSVPQGDIIVTVEELWKALPAWISLALRLLSGRSHPVREGFGHCDRVRWES